MTDLVLHFDADSGADLDAVAKALQAHGAGLSDIADASVEVDRSRVSIPDVLLVLTMATTVLNTSATTLDAVRRTIHALKGVAEELGLSRVRVEVGMAQVPAAELTEDQVKEALAPAT